MSRFLTDFHFIYPWWLLALPVGLLLLTALKRQEPGKSQWHKVCDPHLLEQLLVGEGKVERKRVFSGLVTMLLLATLALAGPTWERLPQPLFRAAEGRVIVLDLSLSMLATDISPSRLTRSRYKAIDLIKAGAGIEQGLVVFAGDGFIVAPLTDDQATLLNLLPALNTKTVPVQGSRADRGLAKALELIQRAAINHGQIILIADDADQQTVTVAREIAQAGHRVDIIAVGTKTGAPVTLSEGGYLKDNRGQIVVPIPDFTSLKKVAEIGAGNYLEIDAGENSFKDLNQLSTLFPENQKESRVTGDQWLNRGPWLLLPLLLIAALSFRKGWLLLIFLSLLLPSENAYALSWDDLWQRPTQRAAKAFKEKDFAEAANLSKDPDWQAAALYRADKFKEAAATLEPLESSLSHYNRGNALAHSGELEKALSAYNKALDIDPDLEDARFNHALVEKLLQQQKEQEKQKSDKESDEQQKSDQDKKSDSPEKSDQKQESEEQQKSDQQQKDEGQKEGEQNSPEKEQPENSQSAENQDNNQESQPGEDAKSPSDKQSENADSAKSSKEKADKGQENEPEKQTAAAEENEEPLDAQQQALKQWLRRVPDDPGGLLKRKFLYQYRERENRSQGHKNW